MQNEEHLAMYLPLSGAERAQEFGFNILTFMILFNSFIPIR
jgi:phospholipid-transporting ATPase